MSKGTNRQRKAVTAPPDVEKKIADLSEALAEEKTKNNALARGYIKKVEELEKVQADVNGYADRESLRIVNNRYHFLKALEAVEEVRKAQKRNTAAANKRAFLRSVKRLVLTAGGGIASILLGLGGFLHMTIALAIATVCLFATGWLYGECIHWFRRCE